jgi:hypothetical protein
LVFFAEVRNDLVCDGLAEVFDVIEYRHKQNLITVEVLEWHILDELLLAKTI